MSRCKIPQVSDASGEFLLYTGIISMNWMEIGGLSIG
jgi:hypothetical protein